MTFNYEVTHSIGTATGTIEADTEADAEAQLKKQYGGEYQTEDGESRKVEITGLTLTRLNEEAA